MNFREVRRQLKLPLKGSAVASSLGNPGNALPHRVVLPPRTKVAWFPHSRRLLDEEFVKRISG
ncbi:hypothetical protein NUACC26_028710 [Scytonema sp. NUACC26]